jgi:UDP-glucose 4-epimerase
MAALGLINLGKLPMLGERFPWTNPAKNNIRYLPINASIACEDRVLPYQIIHEMIDRSAERAIMDFCGCRKAGVCEHFPIELGCLFMGESSLDIPRGVSHDATREEAHAHVEKAVAAGLVPLIGKVRIDNFIFLTPDRSRLLSVCFCCHCCCMMRAFKGLPAARLDRVIRPLEGVEIGLKPSSCEGCGACVETCPFGAIEIVGGKAVHGSSCRRCGRCAKACPNGAVSISWDPEGFPLNLVSSIEGSVSL